MLLFFVVALAWGSIPEQQTSQDNQLSYHLNSLDEIILRNASGTPSLNQLFNQDNSFDWNFDEVIIDSLSLEIASVITQLAGLCIGNAFYYSISINAP